MKVWFAGLVAASVTILCACGQVRSPVEDYLGVWRAFREGTMPQSTNGEVPSTLVVFRDQTNRIVVLLALRAADRQVKFYYGIASHDGRVLKFTDQTGIPYRLSFGESLEHGRFLAAQWDIASVESDLGAFLRVDPK
jgi:hypothetical protein